METFNDALAELRNPDAGGFKYSDTRAAILLNEGIRRLASRSEWIRTELDMGLTVAGQEVYDLPTNVVRCREVLVGSGRYVWVSLDELIGLKSGRLRLNIRNDLAGVFAERFNGDGTAKQFSLYGVPEASGSAILGVASIYPAKPLSGEDLLPFPPDFNRAVVDYAKGIAYENTDENAQAGVYFLQRADNAASELHLLGKSRLGGGVHKAAVAGHR